MSAVVWIDEWPSNFWTALRSADLDEAAYFA